MLASLRKRSTDNPHAAVEKTVEIVCDWCVKVMNYWDQIRNYIQQKVSTESYDNWLKGTGFAAQHGDTLLVSVPDQETQAWLETEFSSLVRTAIVGLKLPVSKIVYEARPAKGVHNQALAAVESSGDPDSGASVLNPKFTFDSFVVGACNQFAHAAAAVGGHEPFPQL